MNESREMVRVDLTARLNATMRGWTMKSMDDLLAEAEALEKTQERTTGALTEPTEPPSVSFGSEGEARSQENSSVPAERQGQRTDLEPSGQKTGKSAPVPVKRSERGSGGAHPQLVVKRSQAATTGKARDEAAAMMNVSPASVERDRLNRQTHGTFEDYCKERWGMTDRRARQLMDASEVVEEIGTIVPVSPATESQARPLTKLEPEAQRQVWTQSNRRD